MGSPFLDAVVRAVGTYSQDITFDTYRKAEQVYLSNGFTTAQSYESTVDDINSQDWRGFPFTPQSAVDHYAKLAYKRNIQYFGYSNGDAGIDMTLSAINKAMNETGATDDRRSVISHSFFVRDDQLAQYQEKKIMAITLPNHIWLYGDVYLTILGEERAKNISPLGSAEKLGVRTGIHNGTPSSGPNVLFSVWSAVNRKTFSGKTLGEEQRISPFQALQGFTVNAAYQYKEELSKGTLAKGMLADLVELDANPLKVNPDDIKNIRVIHTIKHGKRLYTAQ